MGQRDGIMGQEEPLERSPLLWGCSSPLGLFPSEQRWQRLPLELIPMDSIRAGTCSSAHTGPAQPLPLLHPEVFAVPRAPSEALSHLRGVLSSLCSGLA